MAQRCDLTPSKTYANEKMLQAAVDKRGWPEDLRFHVAWTKDGRCYPIFMGTVRMQYGVHFHFPVIGG